MCISPDLRGPNEEMCPWLELDRLRLRLAPLSSSACPAGEKQVGIDAQTRVLVNKTHVEVILFKTTIPVDHARDAAGRRSIWVERSQSLLCNLISSDTENCEIR